MANAKELNQYTQNVRLIEPGDRVIGGTDAPINQPLQALANRTLYLKTQVESKIGNKGTQVIEGQLNIQTNAWEKIRFTNGDGSYWRFETAPVSEGENGARFNYVFTSGSREIGRVHFPRVSGSESVAYQSWVEANAARLATDKMNVATTNYYADQSGGYTKSGFYRSNGRQLDGNVLPTMEIHIAHPEVVNGAHARGIGFSYGSASNPFHLVTSAWDANGRYIGMRTVLTEENGVMLSSDQTVGGIKTFTSKAVFNAGLSVSGNGKSADIHTGPKDIYLRNSKSSKYLQLKDDGTLTYSDVKIALMSDKSDAVNLDSTDNLATSKAVKTAYDNSIRRGGAVGLGGQNHQIAIGWDTPGLIARVDNNVMNVGVPVGAVAYFAQDVPPFGWLKANGAAVSRTIYANLFAAIGERYGRGDGRTTFNLPDLRGEFIRSWDDGRAIDRNRVLGSWQADEFRSHSHGIGVNRMSDTDRGSNPSTVSVDTVGQTDPAGGIETRPRNIALLACIKA